jgi:DNA-binding NarL/FixJ family response regulator
MNGSNKKIKILVADDHKLLRQGLVGLLETFENYEIIGQASNGHEVLAILEEYQPDVIILDIEMPLMNGREALTHINKKYPHIKVIMLTMYSGTYYETEYKSLGAYSFLPKNTSIEVLTEVIDSIKSEKYFYHTPLHNNLKMELCSKHLQLALSEREKEVLKLICDNKSNHFISTSLNISENTIRYHRKNIYSKTRLNSITDLIKYAIKNGIIAV